MARLARVVIPEYPHHVIQRGNRRQQTFFCDDDYRLYLKIMSEWTERCRLAVWSYCLMPNHVHLIIVPETAEGLGRGVGEAHRRYTRHINIREGWLGYLWQGRFVSFVMDEEYLLAAARYIERNPVSAGLVERPEDWPWSSASCHIAGYGDALAKGEWLTERTSGWVCSWQEFLMDEDENEEEFTTSMQHHESTGRPLGTKTFLEKVGTIFGRSLLPKKVGRPRKEEKN